MRRGEIGAGIVLLLTVMSCGGAAEPAPESLAGTWRAVLTSPGGELPFTLRIDAEGSDPPAVAINGPEEVPFTELRRQGSRVTLRIDGYDSEIVAALGSDGTLSGEWSKTASSGRSRLPFRAVRGDRRRFLPAGALPAAAASAPLAARWSVIFTDEDGTEPARAEFRQDGHRVRGTFLTPMGDYRYLEGDYHGTRLRLSCFDGGHAFLFDARLQPDGSLSGDFWSRDSYHATWTALPLGDGADDELPDAFELVGLTNDDGLLRFRFPDLDGRPVSLTDERFHDKAVLVNLFGSWCPNCNDEAPLLAEWHRRYRDRGLEVVGIAYEMTGEPERDTLFVRKFADRHGVEYPLLLGGTSDKAAASATLPDLDRVAAFPTTVFVGRDGVVRRVHSGFAGPGTGAHHDRLVAEFERIIESLLAEGRPSGDGVGG